MTSNFSISPRITSIGGKPVHHTAANVNQPPNLATPTVADLAQAPAEEHMKMGQMIREAFKPAQTGLVVYAFENADHQLFAMNVVLKHMLRERDIGTLPRRAACSQVTYLFNGRSKDLMLEKLLVAPDVDCGLKVVHCSRHAGFDWTADGYGYALDSHLDENPGGSVIIVQKGADTGAAERISSLQLIENIAQEKKVLVALFLPNFGNRHKNARLSEHCSEFVLVQHCEPDIGQDYAFSFDCGEYRQLGRLGLPKMMCSVKFDQDQIVYSFDRFVSTQLDDRIIWMMHAQGKKLEEIALTLRKHKTTIFRRLQSIRGPDMGGIDKAWLEAKLAAFFEVDMRV